MLEQTVRTSRPAEDDDLDVAPEPGVILVFSGERPVLAAERLRGGVLEVGRASFGGALTDDRVSRKHARFELAGDTWRITDFGSTNGTRVDGEPVQGTVEARGLGVVRIGRSLCLPLANVVPFEGATVEVDDRGIAGPILRAMWARLAVLSPRGETVYLRGESGAGKEVAARLFHRLGPSSGGPFVAVNCATIPANIAERLLFGAKRGAYSGADADVDGFVQTAHGGTLFLDEIAELDMAVQAKLLRVLETREVVPLGAVKGRKVNVRICVATHRDLRSEVAAGRFREDLYFRIGRPEVKLPPLRERREEIPYHLEVAVRSVSPSLGLHVTFVEACLSRFWPGNVRELASEARTAAENALAAGSTVVNRTHMDPRAGLHITAAPSVPDSKPQDDGGDDAPGSPDDARFADALAQTNGNVSRAAALLGVHRNRVRRWLEKRRRLAGT